MTTGARVLAALGIGCVGPAASPTDSGGIAPAPVEVDGAQWLLDWNTDGVDPSGAGWAVHTDRGFRVSIEAGWVVSYAVTLVPCETAQWQPAPLWLELLVGRSAWADHAQFTDPSQVEIVEAEDLASPGSVVVDATNFPVMAYCGMHWLVARGDPETEIAGTSLRLEGHWSRDDLEGTFQIDSAFAHALDRDLPTPSGSGTHLDIRITRQLGTLLDGIDFHSANDDTIAWSILSNLTEDAQVQISLR